MQKPATDDVLSVVRRILENFDLLRRDCATGLRQKIRRTVGIPRSLYYVVE